MLHNKKQADETRVVPMMSILKTLEWVAATVAVAAATVFGVMRFAYSDFETQRNSDLYRGQIEKRLDDLGNGQQRLNDKVDEGFQHMNDKLDRILLQRR